MRRIQRERLSEYFKFIRATEGGEAPVRGRASVRIFFFSNFMLHFYFSPLCVRMSARLSVSSVCERASGRVSRSVRLVSPPLPFGPAHFQCFCVWIRSRAAHSPAHRRRRHLLRDARRRQGAQPLPEGQGAAGDPPPQSHGEGELLEPATPAQSFTFKCVSQRNIPSHQCDRSVPGYCDSWPERLPNTCTSNSNNLGRSGASKAFLRSVHPHM